MQYDTKVEAIFVVIRRWAAVAGGVAALNHRLMSETPSG